MKIIFLSIFLAYLSLAGDLVYPVKKSIKEISLIEVIGGRVSEDIEILLKNGIDMNKSDGYYTPLSLATEIGIGGTFAVARLLYWGVDLNHPICSEKDLLYLTFYRERVGPLILLLANGLSISPYFSSKNR